MTVVSSVQFLMESSPLKTTTSVETGAISPDQLAAQDHLFPSPAAPPQVPSVPPPSQVLAAVAAANVQPVLLIRSVQAVHPLVAARISGARFVLLFDAGDEPALRACLEQLRQRLLGVNVLQADELVGQGIGLSWGGVHLVQDAERNPCDMIDRIFRHLLPLGERELTSEQYRVVTRFAAV